MASFFNKYHYNFWRPETAIRAGDADGNPKTEADPSFLPFIATPCFPSYPSNHGSATNGGSRGPEASLRRSWTLDHIDKPRRAQHRSAVHHVRQITDDIDDARVYGGIHFRTDQDAGARLGRAVGREVYKHNLRPVHDDE